MLKDVYETPDSIVIHFTMKQEKGFNGGFFGGNIYDGAGKTIHSLGETSSSGGGVTGDTIEIPKGEYQEPLTFEIAFYPNYLKGSVRIPLKK